MSDRGPASPNDRNGRVEAMLMVLAVAAWSGIAAGRRVGADDIMISVRFMVVGLVVVLLGLGATALPRLGTNQSADSVVSRFFVAVIGVVVAGALLGWWAERGYDNTRRALLVRPVLVAQARLAGDPIRQGTLTGVVLRLDDGARVDARAFGPLGHRLNAMTFGDRVEVAGRLSELGERPWRRSKHIVGRLSVDRIDRVGGPPWYLAPAAEVRRIVDAGASFLPEDLRPLYTGLVTGDDRAQGMGRRAVFRAAGLSHLVAVSGQNVAFVLVVVRPVLRSLPYRFRLLFVALVLGVFLAVTRLEPSVLRAVTCAVLATWASLTGRARSGVGVLAVAVIALLIVDPFLADVVGFQLSVLASFGILTVSPLLVDRFQGPPVVVESLAVTVGAQIAVLPLLILYFDHLSLVSVPANLAVGWAAGAVMMLGVTAGVIAGLLGQVDGDVALAGVAAEVIQWPAELLVRWIDWVARFAVAVPMPVLSGTGAVALGLLTLAWLVRPRTQPSRVGVTLVLAACLVVLAVSTTTRSPGRASELAGGCLWLPQVRVLVVAEPCGPSVVEAVVDSRIGSVAWIVVEGGSRSASTARTLQEITSVGTVLAPPLHDILGARRVTDPLEIVSPSCVPYAVDARAGSCRRMVVSIAPHADRRRLNIDIDCRSETQPVDDCASAAIDATLVSWLDGS